MAEHDDRAEASRRYRELPREEPPAALDSAIRAHARRALEEMHPAPLVPPTGRRQWYFPLAAAAILVLAVSVTWHVEREQPDMVAVGPASLPAHAPAENRAEAAKPLQEPQAAPPVKQDAAGARRKIEKAPQPRNNAALAKEQATRDEAVAPTEPQREAKAATAPAPEASERRADEARPQLGAAARSETMRQRAFAETPEQWLERIAKLRAEGKHDEADKALAEFRKRHPGFRIAPEMLEKVEKR